MMNKKTLTGKQGVALARYLSYFHKDGGVRSTIKWTDDFPCVPDNIYTNLVWEVLEKGNYNLFQARLLNKYIRPILIANKNV